jgi:hypothetical protein
VLLGIESKTLDMLGKYFIIELYSQPSAFFQGKHSHFRLGLLVPPHVFNEVAEGCNGVSGLSLLPDIAGSFLQSLWAHCTPLHT